MRRGGLNDLDSLIALLEDKGVAPSHSMFFKSPFWENPGKPVSSGKSRLPWISPPLREQEGNCFWGCEKMLLGRQASFLGGHRCFWERLFVFLGEKPLNLGNILCIWDCSPFSGNVLSFLGRLLGFWEQLFVFGERLLSRLLSHSYFLEKKEEAHAQKNLQGAVSEEDTQ